MEKEVCCVDSDHVVNMMTEDSCIISLDTHLGPPHLKSTALAPSFEDKMNT